MTFASGAFGQLRYIPEVTQGVTPVAGNGVNLRMTNPTMKAAVSTVKSNEISSTRMVSGSTNVDIDVSGGFDFELSGKEYDPFIEASGYGAFAHYGTNGLGSTFSCTTAAGTITAGAAPTGGSAFTGLAAGSWFKLNPPAGASDTVKAYFADKWFKVASTTSTEITLDAATQISGAGLGITAVAGFSVTQSVVSNGNTAKFFTFEYDQTDIAQLLQFRGMQTNSMDLKLDVGSIITGSFDFMGMSHGITQTTTLPGTPVASQSLDPMNAVTDVGLVMENGANLLSAGSFIKSVSLNIANNLRAQKAVGVFGNAGIGSGELAVSGSLEVYFEDATYYNKWLNGTTTSLAIGMADQLGNGYMFEMDKVKFKDGGLNMGGKDSDVMLSLPFDAFYNAGTGRGIRITRAISA
jgi:hypothetical protein